MRYEAYKNSYRTYSMHMLRNYIANLSNKIIMPMIHDSVHSG